MKLQGVNVLIDAYNLELPYSTGIKTYGKTLIKALQLLGANVKILTSKNLATKEPILSEVLWYDTSNNSPLNRFSLFISGIKAVSGILWKASKIKRAGFVIPKDREDEAFLDSVDVFALPRCYTIAYLVQKIYPSATAIIPERIDIWHTTYPVPLQIKGAKRITTIHDLIPLRLPYATLDDKKVFYRNVKSALKSSAVILTVSESTKNDILEAYEIDPNKIFVTYQPVFLPQISHEKVHEVVKSYGLKYGDYILFVGTIEPKKNVARLIRAYNLVGTNMPLAIVGRKGWMYEDVEPLLKKKGVKWLSNVPSKDLSYLYAGAYCFVFPSLYEGFGLPPLEAMSVGCPVITSNVSSLPEVCGDAALYVDPYNVSDIREKLEKILSDRDLREKMVSKGRERAKLFSMENYIEKLYKAYSSVL
ncbi:N-acetylgalactosamine-N,N'-diacetylbacillosaminyl-diphospho-undecaprenol 4-alpha-N-acetylgalactosaminyltransferase [Fervidicola ferrireducens]|uniref:N-acetylgalactosamine-N, N'-diacetylbacillosaminyl-diphospho-undecaprenol 4-alpha-N-acetylgalactosaminyltransferase n=1 Tax=Fervidicola ferrireducens TaxID=520764 RepID=A0A140LCS4_9FIRM|nr:glycosyltransferase family 1 protein [Fervidicola ferrireducens]KXG78349.1 N-acetylgalactosamine-N,N'-diacetylbacillosaminyl-diphospho-undecaprenol 4-alpha-N-acetylgalactosaminyltransferase [Fervidicola ferrireducens]